jgi:fibronectin-binding autotransporter adhesin
LANIKSEAYGLGATATWHGTAGTYFDLQGQVNWISSDISSSTAGNLVNGHKSTAYALSAEVGHRVELASGGALIPQAQLTWGNLKSKGYTDAAGNAVAASSNESLIGRLGLTYQGSVTENGQFHVIGNIRHDFSSAQTGNVGGIALSSEAQSTWFEIGVGGNMEIGANQFIYGEARYRAAANRGAFENKGLNIAVGFRMSF